MADTNGADNTQQRLDALEQMNKLLLRAQVLQQDALEQNIRAIERHDKAIERHDKWIAEAAEREKRLDDRIERLVTSIGELISRMPT